MQKLAFKIALLLTAPAALLTGTGALAQTDTADDPFDFLLDESNTVMSHEQPSAEAQTPPSSPAATPQTITPAAAVPAAAIVLEKDEEDPFAFLLDETSTSFSSAVQRAARIADDRGEVSLEVLYISDDNFTFGRYNGLYEEGFVPLINADYRDWLSAEPGEQPHYWRLHLRDVGSEVAEGAVTFGKRANYSFTLAFDQQLQVNNDSGHTPFSGDTNLTLPSGWVADNTTGGMTGLNVSNREFTQQLERDAFSFNYLQQLTDLWSMGLKLQLEDKQGQKTLGGAFYIDAASPLSSILPQAVDQTTSEVALNFQYQGDALQFNGGYLYSIFDNHNNSIEWQNPYDGNFGAGVDYPNGYGRIATEPDTELHQLQAQVSYFFNPKWRAVGDLSYSLSSQDDDFYSYTVNPTLVVDQPLPRDSLDANIGTTVANAGLLMRPLNKLGIDLRYKFYDRSNNSPRDGYLYPRGDSADQPESLQTIYNRPYEMTKNTFQLNARYRLPKRMRLKLDYQFENIARYNSAVKKTDENSLEAALLFSPSAKTSGRVSLGYSDRAASKYYWDQSYYALLDTELINLTPDNQRYTNHPALSQYYLSNREMLEAKFNFAYMPNQHWNLNLDLRWDDKDYDKSELGLTQEEHVNLTFGANYQANDQLAFSGYYSYDDYQSEQSGLSFRGGAEKNAFASAPPYPQASDPSRKWTSEPESSFHALGVNALWDIKPGVFDMVFDYSFVDTTIEQRFKTYGASDLLGESLPDDGSRLHNFKWDANYYPSDTLSFKFSYQYYRFDEDRWATDGVASNTLDHVLGTGEQPANDTVHVFGLSVQFQLP